MQAKSGKKQSLVKPTAPESAFDADEADPGSVAKDKAEQVATGTGKYGKQIVKPFKPPAAQSGGAAQAGGQGAVAEEEKSWIEIELVDEADQPVAGVRYEVKLPDGSVASGVLDGDGLARIDGIDPGTCEITFPELDKDAWEKA
jgi:hypothetical protein